MRLCENSPAPGGCAKSPSSGVARDVDGTAAPYLAANTAATSRFKSLKLDRFRCQAPALIFTLFVSVFYRERARTTDGLVHRAKSTGLRSLRHRVGVHRPPTGRIGCRRVLGGLIKDYCREAAEAATRPVATPFIESHHWGLEVRQKSFTQVAFRIALSRQLVCAVAGKTPSTELAHHGSILDLCGVSGYDVVLELR